MSILQSELWEAPVGEDLTSEPMTLSTLWQLVQGYLCDQSGKVRGVGQMTTTTTLGTISASVDGVGYLDTTSLYYQFNTSSISGYLLFATGGTLKSAALVTGPVTFPPTFTSVTNAITGMGSGKRIRMVPFGADMILVQDGASSNYRVSGVTGTGATLGIPDPASAPTFTTTTGTIPAGVYYYVYTYYDNEGNESDISPVSAAYTSNAGSAGGTNLTIPAPPGGYGTINYVGANIYRTLVNQVGSYYFLVNNGSTGTYNDDISTVAGQTAAPLPGLNGPPLAGNQLCVWRNRVWMNVSTQPYLIQCSNNGSATQWSSIYVTGTYPATAGLVIRVQSSNSDFVVGFAPLSSILLVFKRYSIYSVLGYDASSFTVQEFKTTGHSGSVAKGCCAPDSIQVCDDVAVFLATDGVYATDASGTMTKISKMSQQGNGGIEAALIALQSTTAGRTALQNAVAWYVDRTYYINVNGVIYAFNFDRQAWSTVLPSNFSGANVNCAGIMLCSQLPAFALVGLAASPWGVYSQDNYTANQTITNLTLTTQCLQARDKVKTVRRLRIFGTVNSFTSGTLTCYFDGYSEAYTVYLCSTQNLEEAARGVLFFQEFTDYAQGREVYFTLSLDATGAVLTHWMTEYVVQEGQG